MFCRVLTSTRPIAAALAAAALALTLSGCSEGAPVTMPNVVGKKLDIAKSDVQRAGINDDAEVLGGGVLGVVVESNWTVCSQEPAGGSPITAPPRLTVSRTCDSKETATSEPSKTLPTPTTEAYKYRGPKYEVVVVDEDQTPAKLSQYWVKTHALDYSKGSYKSQVKLIIADITRQAGTDSLLVEVVTDKDIALAESPSTYEKFIEERGMDYAVKEVPKKEKKGYIATYSGGYDFNLGESSDKAFGIDWWPAADTSHEDWKPGATG